MSAAKPIVSIQGLSKQFKKCKALTEINLKISPGGIIGLLGPNGCGKSTLIRHIIGMYLPTSGSCITLGCEASKLGSGELQKIGYVHQEGQLLNWMTVEQLIRYISSYYPHWDRALEKRFIEDFGLNLKNRVGALSPGQRQKLSILIAICHEPDLLILDEPVSAFDPIARARFLELLLEIIQKENKTILIASHILTDIEKVIDHVILMREGRILHNQSLDDFQERFIRLRLNNFKKPLPEKLPFEKVLSCKRNDHQAILTIDASNMDHVARQAENLHCQIETQHLPLEDIYNIIMMV
jgi:ABC-2 type transport system ATP-binding protein